MGNDRRRDLDALLELDDPASLEGSEGLESGIPPGPLTVVPEFDLVRYAEESEVRERAPTLIDDEALEQARIKSLPSRLPPPRPPASTVPGPLARNPRDSLVEVNLGEEDMDALDSDQQIALLRDRLDPLERVPTLARKLTELGAVLEDPKTAYVLGFVDGILPIETIIDVTGLPELDTLKILDRMVSLSVVLFRTSDR